VSSTEKERLHDQKLVREKKNTARYFTERRQVSWVLLIGTVVWGVFAYIRMPKAKDPLVPVRVAVATCIWPGATAEKMEQLVTRKIEQKMAENSKVEKIESISRTSTSIVYVTLNESVVDRGKELDDIKGKLDSIRDLPQGAQPINFIKDFGDTSALLLTVASPQVNDVELELRARAIAHAIGAVRPAGAKDRATLVVAFPPSINSQALRRVAQEALRALGGDSYAQLIEGPGFLGIDLSSQKSDAQLVAELVAFAQDRLRLSELHPDVWRPVVIRDLKDTAERLRTVVGDRYSYRQLDEYTDTIQRYLQTVPQVSKITRSGVLPEQIYLDYSQERLAAYGIQESQLGDLLAARNITMPGGNIEVGGKNVTIDPSGEFHSEQEIGDVLMAGPGLKPQYLRNLVEVSREYQSPPRFLNYITLRNPRDKKDGKLVRARAITLAVQMRAGEQIADFGKAVDKRLAEVERLLPEDLIAVRTSDQPLQVKENVSLFMSSLYEAIALVVLVGLIGFWEWRSALLLALSIPITLAMTFGFMHLLGIDVQQISIASLILALGLLVDDPVVAGDAIKRSLSDGWRPLVAAWLGPTKLEVAILFATITNIVAYLPLLALGGDVGTFIYTLPIVLTCSLVASRIVSMTFIPLLAYYLLRPNPKGEETLAERRTHGFAKYYYAAVGWAIDHRRWVLSAAFLLVVAGFSGARTLKTAFFPQDLSYLSYVDVWLPEDAPLSATRQKAAEAEKVIAEVAEKFQAEHHEKQTLESITSFIGGGAPRFWFSVSPEQQQQNYAQLMIKVTDKHDTPHLVPLLQAELSRRIAGARLDVRQLENGKAVGIPIQVRIAGDDMDELRKLSGEVQAILRRMPNTERVRDDWGAETFSVKLEVDPDRANLAGVTNYDVAISSAAAMNGRTASVLREGDRQIPIVARLRAEERAQLDDIRNLYVTSQQQPEKLPLRQVSRIAYKLETEKIRRRNQFRTITVSCFPVAGVLASEVVRDAEPAILALQKTVPPGYELTIGGEKEEQKKGFAQLVVVLGLSIGAIFLALVIQFKSAVKPVVVFAAIPFGVAGALVSLAAMHAPFGFMAFLGIVSLIGVIVSHVIVLFDFIEEAHERGESLREALLDAGIVRLRPVLITVGATVLGLVPLAIHGGPLWQPLCYAQIGGLTVATMLTLVLVPVLYSAVVLDLKWISWERPHEDERGGAE
jgi:multidrug efflux pump subunit AcrB